MSNNKEDTEKLEPGRCAYHSGICAETKRNSADIQRMIGWVIAGAGAVIIQLGIAIFSLMTTAKHL